MRLFAGILDKDLVIGDHLIPQGTACLFSNEILARDVRHFGPDPEEFRPERWIESDARSSGKIHPFSVRPFGFGKRICLGKRFAELELQLAVIKLVKVCSLKISKHPKVKKNLTRLAT